MPPTGPQSHAAGFSSSASAGGSSGRAWWGVRILKRSWSRDGCRCRGSMHRVRVGFTRAWNRLFDCSTTIIRAVGIYNCRYPHEHFALHCFKGWIPAAYLYRTGPSTWQSDTWQNARGNGSRSARGGRSHFAKCDPPRWGCEAGPGIDRPIQGAVKWAKAAAAAALSGRFHIAA